MAQGRPIVLGIVGDSAAGKTTVTRGLISLLGPDRVSHVCADDYHRYDRAERACRGVTALHPDANHLDILELHLERLHYGQPILKPVYDHSCGRLVRPDYVQPREFVIVEGLLGYHTPVMRQFYDVKVYLDPPEELRRVWKIRRDTAKRGYELRQVVGQLERREADSRDFIRPQRAHADIVVQFYPPEGTPAEEAGPNLNVRLTLRPTIPHPDLSDLFDGAEAPPAGIRLQLDRDAGRPVDVLEIDGNVTPEHAARLEETVWRHVPDLRPLPPDRFGDYHDRAEVRHSDPLAITQLLLTCHLLRERAMAHRFAPPVAALSRLEIPAPARAAAESAQLAPPGPRPRAAEPAPRAAGPARSSPRAAPAPGPPSLAPAPE